MKKGCFLTTISLLTIIVAVIIYIFRFHGDDVFNKIKPYIFGKRESKVYARMDKLIDKNNVDTLKNIIVEYENNLKSEHKINMDSINDFFDKVNQILDDGKIEPAEIAEIKLYLKKQY